MWDPSKYRLLSLSAVAAVVLTLACTHTSLAPQVSQSSSPDWLYAWAASGDTAHSGAFLAQIDLRESSPTFGKLVRTIPAGEGSSGTHHTEHSLQSDGLLFADDFGLGRTFIFNLSDPSNPRLQTSFTTAGPFGWPHSYVRLPSGNRLVTYQFQSSKFNTPPGGLAEVRADGTIVRYAAAKTEGIDDKQITPYSLEIIPSLDRAVSTTTSMVEDTGVGLQIWRLSDLKLLHTLRIPSEHVHGAQASDTMPHHLFPGEPRLLADGKTVMLATFTCGLYTVTGIETDAPRVNPVYSFPGQNCAVPVLIGKYWVQTVPEIHTVVALDVSNPASPREVSRIDLGEGSKPHWLAADASGQLLVVNNGSRRGTNLYLLRFDKSNGALSRYSKLPTLELNRVAVEGLGEVPGVPHGAVFSR